MSMAGSILSGLNQNAAYRRQMEARYHASYQAGLPLNLYEIENIGLAAGLQSGSKKHWHPDGSCTGCGAPRMSFCGCAYCGRAANG